MTYLIIGNDELAEKEIDKLKENIIETNINRYDLEESSLVSVLEDLNTYSLFGDKKLVIVKNYDFTKDVDKLTKYLENQNDNILIFTNNKKPTLKKDVQTIFNKNVKTIDFSKSDTLDYIKEELKDYKISNMNAILLKDYCNDNYSKIQKEIEKLKLYKEDDKEITDKDIKTVVKKSFDGNIFDLTNAVLLNDKDKIFKCFYEQIDNNVDELSIISILYNNFRLIYKIKLLLQTNSDEEIISILKLHPYRYKKLKELTYNYSEERLLKLIKKLSNIDINIKSGKIDKKLALELFFAKL